MESLQPRLVPLAAVFLVFQNETFEVFDLTPGLGTPTVQPEMAQRASAQSIRFHPRGRYSSACDPKSDA